MLFERVYSDWSRLMSWCRVTDENEGRDQGRDRRILINALYAAYLLYSCMRLGFMSYVVPDDMYHYFGNTIINTGTAAMLICAGPGLGIAQLTAYRLVAVVQTANGDLIYLRTLQAIGRETCRRLRVLKIKMARMVYLFTIAGSIGFMICGTIAVYYFLHLNLQQAKSSFEVTCWSFWFLQDLFVVLAVTTSMATYPAAWMLIVLDYRVDLVSLINRIREERWHSSLALSQPLSVRLTVKSVQSLGKKAEQVNRTCSPILAVMTLAALPVACICMFVTKFSDMVVLQYAYALIGANFTLFAFALQIIAGDVSAKSERVFLELAAMAFNGRNLDLDQRILLLKLMEESESSRQPLAMYTCAG